jgi:hypothetical protein
MSGAVTGTQTNDFAVHARNAVAVTLEIGTTGSIQLVGFTDEDDCISWTKVEDDITYTSGLYGSTSANINTNRVAELTLKLRASNDDNQRIADWHRRTIAGDVQAGTIIISDANYRTSCFNCLPRKFADGSPGSSEDPSVEWTINVGNIEPWKGIA